MIHTVDRLVNPVTRTVVRFTSPAECIDEEDFADLLSRFEIYCQQAWGETPRRDPKQVDPYKLRDWQ